MKNTILKKFILAILILVSIQRDPEFKNEITAIENIFIKIVEGKDFSESNSANVFSMQDFMDQAIEYAKKNQTDFMLFLDEHKEFLEELNPETIDEDQKVKEADDGSLEKDESHISVETKQDSDMSEKQGNKYNANINTLTQESKVDIEENNYKDGNKSEEINIVSVLKKPSKKEAERTKLMGIGNQMKKSGLADVKNYRSQSQDSVQSKNALSIERTESNKKMLIKSKIHNTESSNQRHLPASDAKKIQERFNNANYVKGNRTGSNCKSYINNYLSENKKQTMLKSTTHNPGSNKIIISNHEGKTKMQDSLTSSGNKNEIQGNASISKKKAPVLDFSNNNEWPQIKPNFADEMKGNEVHKNTPTSSSETNKFQNPNKATPLSNLETKRDLTAKNMQETNSIEMQSNSIKPEIEMQPNSIKPEIEIQITGDLKEPKIDYVSATNTKCNEQKIDIEINKCISNKDLSAPNRVITLYTDIPPKTDSELEGLNREDTSKKEKVIRHIEGGGRKVEVLEKKIHELERKIVGLEKDSEEIKSNISNQHRDTSEFQCSDGYYSGPMNSSSSIQPQSTFMTCPYQPNSVTYDPLGAIYTPNACVQYNNPSVPRSYNQVILLDSFKFYLIRDQLHFTFDNIYFVSVRELHFYDGILVSIRQGETFANTAVLDPRFIIWLPTNQLTQYVQSNMQLVQSNQNEYVYGYQPRQFVYTHGPLPLQ